MFMGSLQGALETVYEVIDTSPPNVPQNPKQILIFTTTPLGGGAPIEQLARSARKNYQTQPHIMITYLGGGPTLPRQSPDRTLFTVSRQDPPPWKRRPPASLAAAGAPLARRSPSLRHALDHLGGGGGPPQEDDHLPWGGSRPPQADDHLPGGGELVVFVTPPSPEAMCAPS